MEVVKSNFSALLPQVKDAINDCNFMAIDTELTGLHNQLQEHAFDTIADRYSKYRESCLQFIIVQFGLSTFKYHPQQRKYTHRDFNFYVFNVPHTKEAPDPKFMCQSSSVQFLASQSFDFNKVIYEGIPYLSSSEELKIKELLKNKHKNEVHKMDVPKGQEQFFVEICEAIDMFLNNDVEAKMHLDQYTSIQQKLIFDIVRQKYDGYFDVEFVVNKECEKFTTLVKTTKAEEYGNLNMKQGNELDCLDTAVGFRKVIDHISQSKKLVVGHNMLLDIMHTLDQFYHPIPEKLVEFKQILNRVFPLIMDTKVLASSNILKEFIPDTSLGTVARTVQQNPFKMQSIESASGFTGYTLESKKEHEAGFDAFLTGVAYIGLTDKLRALSCLPIRYFEPTAKHLISYLNNINIMRHYDVHVLKICDADSKPDTSNVFHIRFPEYWNKQDLINLFSRYGYIYISWLDSESALIALKNKENFNRVKSDFLQKYSHFYTVQTYSQYQESVFKETLAKKTCLSTKTMEWIPEAKIVVDPEWPYCKKQRYSHEENDKEVTSTAKVFEECNDWS